MSCDLLVFVGPPCCDIASVYVWQAACQPFRPRMFSVSPPGYRPTYAHDRLTDIQQTAPPIGIDGAVGLSAITGSDLFRRLPSKMFLMILIHR